MQNIDIASECWYVIWHQQIAHMSVVLLSSLAVFYSFSEIYELRVNWRVMAAGEHMATHLGGSDM